MSRLIAVVVLREVFEEAERLGREAGEAVGHGRGL
jgi:hypothetical protein